jgi:hypothetical protein
MSLIGQRFNARDEPAQSSFQAHTNRPAHAPQGDPLQQQACNHGAWLDLHQVLGGEHDSCKILALPIQNIDL